MLAARRCRPFKHATFGGYPDKTLHAAMASFVPDFCSGLGIASLFDLARSFDTTTEEINSLTSNWVRSDGESRP